MLNFQRILTTLSIASLTVVTACGTTTGGGDATDGTSSDAATGDDSMGDMSMGDTTAMAAYKSVVIWDKSQDPGFVNGKCGTSPGTDLDCVGLYRGGVLIGVGKPGTATYAAPATASPCTVTANKSAASAAEGPLDGKVFASSPDSGYISLNGGSLEIQFGACKTGTTIKDCDGAGALVDVMAGDQVGVWEVDTTYKAGGAGEQAGNAYDGCVCYADEYQVEFRTAVGSETGAVYFPADATKYNTGTAKIIAP